MSSEGTTSSESSSSSSAFMDYVEKSSLYLKTEGHAGEAILKFAQRQPDKPRVVPREYNSVLRQYFSSPQEARGSPPAARRRNSSPGETE